MGQKPSGKNDLLLVSAGQRSDRGLPACGLDIEHFDIFIRKSFRFAPADRPEKALHDLCCKNDILADTQVCNNAVAFSVFREIPDPVFHCVDRFCNSDIFAVHLDGPARHFVRTENSSYAFAPARA